MNAREHFSMRRLIALCRKESYQIVRDPSSIVIAFVLPVVLLFIFGYGVNLDSARIQIGVLSEDSAPEAAAFVTTLAGSPYFEVHQATRRADLAEWLTEGRIRGFVVLQPDFGARLDRPGATAPIEVVTDGSEPNTANFVGGYLQGAWATWNDQRRIDRGGTRGPSIEVVSRYWFNPAAISRNFIVPGSIAIIMTIIGALLTSLVVAREWERGTMEALLSTPMRRAEFLTSKTLPYFVLGLASMLICLVVAVWVFKVPFRGSLPMLLLLTSFFLGSSLGLGLLLSTVTRNQFTSAQAALQVAFLPATMLSGFIFEIASMPVPIQAVTYLFSARYFVNALQTLFQAGFVGRLLFQDLLLLAIAAVIFLGATAVKTRQRLD